MAGQYSAPSAFDILDNSKARLRAVNAVGGTPGEIAHQMASMVTGKKMQDDQAAMTELMGVMAEAIISNDVEKYEMTIVCMARIAETRLGQA